MRNEKLKTIAITSLAVLAAIARTDRADLRLLRGWIQLDYANEPAAALDDLPAGARGKRAGVRIGGQRSNRIAVKTPATTATTGTVGAAGALGGIGSP